MRKLFMVIPLVFLLCFTFACQDKEAMAELEAMKAQKAIEEQNKEIARNFFSALDKNDIDEMQRLCSEDISIMASGLAEPMGLEIIPLVIKAVYSAFPDWVHSLEELVAEGDKVAVKIIQTGTHKGDYEGIPPTDKKVTMPALVLLTISDGKIKEFWAVEDYLDFNQQLGMELKPKEGEK